ncbi:MAG: tolB protein precursor [Myxococcaceae bacterium]|nr:tolB protein precursor [Myxococcaceae bacterium]
MRPDSKTALLLPGLGAALLAALAGCDAGPSTRDCNSRLAYCDGGMDSTTAVDIPFRDVRPIDTSDLFTGLQSVSITPANPTVVVRGVVVNQPFMAFGTYADGTVRPITLGTWSLTRARAGSIDPATGTFTATGQVGDVTEVHYELPRPGADALRATTNLTVRYEREFFAAPSTEADRARFATVVTDPTRAAVVRYPLDTALMPQNVAPLDVQWEQGAAGDVYRVRLTKAHVAVTGFVTHSGAAFRFDWNVDPAGWRALVESDLDEPIALRVDRATAGAAIEGPARTVRVAQGSLAGAIYYWDLRAGRILRIREELTGPVRETVLANPPTRATGPAENRQCVACHTISRDGLQMAAELWEGQGPSTVFDLAAGGTPTRFPSTDTAASPSWVYASFNANGTRLIANRLDGLFLVNPATGAVVPPAAGTLPRGNSVQPSWSPDNNTIAFVSDATGDGPTAFGTSGLSTIPVTGADSFGAVAQRVTGGSLATQREGGRAVAYPTWTPDSRWIAFQHGPYSESDRAGATATAPRTRFPAALYLIGPAGGTPTRLTNASADEREDDAYFPNFSPFVQGGQYWLLYFSRRDYGNAQAGTRGTGRRQLWVTAVSTAVTPGADPSSVPYWLPGQDVASDNVSGFWAPQPCRPRGMSCTVSSECCAGTCGPNAAGALVCNPPPPEAMCRREGERCGADGDCCDGLSCAANVCLRPPG